MQATFFRNMLLVVTLAVLTGCSSTPPALFKTADDLKTYKKFIIPSLSITSDVNGDGEKEANEKLKSYYENKMSSTITSKLDDKAIYKVGEVSKAEGRVLIVEESIQVHYGSRALRYWVGFGAGKGSAILTLKAKDKVTNEEKFSDVRVVELTMGGFGGNFEGVIQDGVNEQIEQFSKTLFETM